MTRDWYLAPAGLGTSGSGHTRSNPIYGLSNIASLGIAEGDRVIVTKGSFYERFVIPQNGIRVISEDAVFDGTTRINGLDTFNTSWVKNSGSAWRLIPGSNNVWKKGCATFATMFIDGQWAEPMPSSNQSTNTEQFVLENIQEYEYTHKTVALDGQGKTTYLRLPIGDSPNKHDIEVCQQIDTLTQARGYLQASQKQGLGFEGQFTFRGITSFYGFCAPVWLDRCVDTTNKQAEFNMAYSLWGVRITGGDRVRIKASGDHLYNAVVSIDAADPYLTGPFVTYTAGEIEVFDWTANYCGWMPRYNGVDVNYGTDADGGVSVGFHGGLIDRVIIRDGKCNNPGPSVSVMKAGWVGNLVRGSGVLVGTVDPTTINKMDIYGIHIKNSWGQPISVGGTSVNNAQYINVHDCIIEGHRGYPIAINNQKSLIGVRPTAYTTGNVKINVSNNLFIGGTHSSGVISLGHATAGNNTTEITACNNVIQGVGLEAGYSGNYGNIRVVDLTCVGTKNFNGNIADGPVPTGIYGRVGNTTYADFAAWQAAGYDLQGQQGTVVINSDYSLSAGTANPIFAGIDYWSPGPNPTSINGEPRPPKYSDVGPFQGTSHEFHPANMA